VARYKQQLLREEVIELDARNGVWTEREPNRRHALNQAFREVGLQPSSETRAPSGMTECVWTPAQLEEFKRLHPDPVRERIRIRYIDPRAAGQPQAAAKGGVTLVSLFGQEQRRADGELEGPRMLMVPAFSGKDRDEGVRAVNDFLDFDDDQPVVPCLNEPRLYVSTSCEQVDWTLTHFTGEGAEDDGAKDVADLIRYMALTEDVRHLAGGLLVTGGFKEGF
jgi:hypothetical protein